MSRRLFPDPGPLDETGLFSAYTTNRDQPSIRLNFVSSLDGAVELEGHSRGLSSPLDQRLLLFMRAHADAVLVGAGTLRHEGYGPVRLKEDLAVRRAELGLSDPPTLVIVSSALDLDPGSRVFTEAPVRPVVLTHASAPADKRKALRQVADVIVTGESVVDLAVGRDELAQRGVTQVLCEGGPHLFGALLVADLVDELCLTVSPLLTGPGAGRIVAGPTLNGVRPMRLVHVIEDDGHLFTRYARA